MSRKLFIFSCVGPLACGKYLSILSATALLTSGGPCPIPYHCDDFNYVSSLPCKKEDIIMSSPLKRFLKSDRVGDAILKQLECARWIPTGAPIEGEDLSRCEYATAAFYLALVPKLYNPICTNITPPMLRTTLTSTTTSITTITSTKTPINISESASKSRNNFTANDMCPPLDCPEFTSTTPANAAIRGVDFAKAFSRTPTAIILTNSESSRSAPIHLILLIICWFSLLPYFLEKDPIISLALSLASKAFM